MGKYMTEEKIILNYNEFKEVIENITDEYTQTYRGDWDWNRITSFEMKDGYVLKKERYYSNGAASPDDNDEKILFFEKK